MEQRISGHMVQTGVQVQETYSLTLDLSDEQQNTYRQDPTAVLRQFLEQEGHIVNAVSLLVREGTVTSETTDSTTVEMRNAYHIVYPGNERSGWICA